MSSRRLLQLAAISVAIVFLATQDHARSETASPSAPRVARTPVSTGLANFRRAPGPAFDPAQAQSLPLLIDGEKTPELISDTVAFGHFVRSAVVPAETADQARMREGLVLRPLQLEDADAKALMQTLRSVREDMDRIEHERRTLNGSSWAGRARAGELEQEEAKALQDARMHLARGLTTGGATRLHDHLSGTVKRGIKAYGSIP